MNLDGNEEEALRALVHDMNGQLFLIRGHCEIAKRSDSADQKEKCLQQIQSSTDQLERLVREMRAQLGFPKVVQT